jgi:hypothetical protein
MTLEHANICFDAGPYRRTTPAEQDLAPAAFRARLGILPELDLKDALPVLMMELDRMLNAPLSAEQRLRLLKYIRSPVLKAILRLPKPPVGPQRIQGRPPAGMTLEQRLMLLMTRNLRQALYELDRCQCCPSAGDDADRAWVMRQVFRFIGRQIRYGIDWDRPWPKHTWQDLHDLFLYLGAHGPVPAAARLTAAAWEGKLDVEVEYKRLLLLGLTDQLTGRRSGTTDFFHLLKRWAVDSRLQEPECTLGQAPVVKVEVTRDEPPRLRDGALNQSFRGWVLRPADAFVDYVKHVTRDGGHVVRFNAFRSVRSLSN